MKISTFICIALSTSLLAACSGGGGSKGPGVESKDSTVQPTEASKHMATECPDLTGEYESQDKMSKIEVKTSPISGGIKIDASGVEWIVDGKSHAAKDENGNDNGSLSYVGVCSKGTVTLDLSASSTYLGKLQYELNGVSLTASAKFSDKTVGQDSNEVWTLKK